MTRRPKQFHIYLIHSREPELYYVGATGDFEGRMGSHARRLSEGGHKNRALQAVWDADPGALTAEIICTFRARSARDVCDMENSYIESYRGRFPGKVVNRNRPEPSPFRGYFANP